MYGKTVDEGVEFRVGSLDQTVRTGTCELVDVL